MKREAQLYHQLVKLAKEKPRTRAHLVPLIKQAATRMRIGPGGLEDVESGITLQPNTEYYMGASSSPDHIIVTKVTPDKIFYKTYPYKKELQIQRWVGEDLIMQGTRRWLSSGYSKYHPELAKSLKSMLSGGRGKTVDLRDFMQVTVLVSPRNPDPANPSHDIRKGDLWYHAEEYGNVAGLGNSYEIDTDMQRAKELAKDPLFVIEKINFR